MKFTNRETGIGRVEVIAGYLGAVLIGGGILLVEILLVLAVITGEVQGGI